MFASRYTGEGGQDDRKQQVFNQALHAKNLVGNQALGKPPPDLPRERGEAKHIKSTLYFFISRDPHFAHCTLSLYRFPLWRPVLWVFSRVLSGWLSGVKYRSAKRRGLYDLDVASVCSDELRGEGPRARDPPAGRE
jgi:hypothetical protein